MKTGPKPKTLMDRFLAKAVQGHGCWTWTGVGRTNGYGVLSKGGSLGGIILAHRAAFLLFKGEIPDGLLVRHSCDNKLCVNPDHLLLGTHQDNMNDAVERRRMCAGERQQGAKLTSEKVAEARSLHASGASIASLARRYGIADETLGKAIHRKTWRHVA